MDKTGYYANADEVYVPRPDDEAHGERREADDRRSGTERRKQPSAERRQLDRRADDRVRKARLTPQEIAALLRGAR